jgi:hypothetical protein
MAIFVRKLSGEMHMPLIRSRTGWLRSWSAATLALACSCAAVAADYTSSVVAGGLNPRGLAFGPDGGLYITEAGIAAGSGPSTRGGSGAGNLCADAGRGRRDRVLAPAPDALISCGQFAHRGRHGGCPAVGL